MGFYPWYSGYSSLTIGYGFPCGGYSYYSWPYADYGYGCWPSYCSPYLYPPPLVIPAETIYGPLAVQRFMGLAPVGAPIDPDAVVAARPVVNAIAPAANAPRPNNAVAPPAPNAEAAAGGGFGLLAPAARAADEKPRQRASNADARARAERFLDYGDIQFDNGRFTEAYSRYRMAVRSAPDMAEAHARTGMALVALGNYVGAAQSFREALALAPQWIDSEFRLDLVYGENHIAKEAHRERLVQALTEDPENADLLFVLGVFLYFDGQAKESATLFRRAADLLVDGTEHVDVFLRRFAREDAADGDRAL